MTFKFQDVLSRVMKSHTTLLCPTQDMIHPFVQCPGLFTVLVIR